MSTMTFEAIQLSSLLGNGFKKLKGVKAAFLNQI